MDNKIINEIRNSVDEFRESRKVDFNCPNLSFIVNELIHNIIPSLKNRTIPREDLREMLGAYKLVTRDAIITTEEIKNNLDIFQKEFIKNKEKAISVGKKLFVVLGENHDFQGSMFFEFLISTILKENGFNSALIENSKIELEELINNFSDRKDGLDLQFYKDILGMELTAIDPLHDEKAEVLLNIPRCNAINTEIAKNSQQDQMAIVGAAHLEHIINSKEISDKFVVLPINIQFPKRTLPIELTKSMNYDKSTEVPKEVITLNLSDSIESFSLNQLLDIYIDVLPLILGEDELFTKDIEYSSDFSRNYDQCKEFDNIPLAVTMLEQRFGDLINDSINDL